VIDVLIVIAKLTGQPGLSPKVLIRRFRRRKRMLRRGFKNGVLAPLD
jgi:hypothetical protein